MSEGRIIKAAAPKEYFFEEGCFITEYCNTPEITDVSIAEARVPPGVTTRWHRLTGVKEMYVILSGEGIVELKSGAQAEAVSLSERVKPGDKVVIPPDWHQRIHNPGNTDLIFLAVCSPRFAPECYTDTESSHKSVTSLP